MHVAQIDKILWRFQEHVYPGKVPLLHVFRKPHFWTGTTGSGAAQACLTDLTNT